MKIEITIFLALCCIMAAQALPKTRSVRQNLAHLRASLARRQGGDSETGSGEAGEAGEAGFEDKVLEKLDDLSDRLSKVEGDTYYAVVMLEGLVYGDDYYGYSYDDSSYWNSESDSGSDSTGDDSYDSGDDSYDSGDDSDDSGDDSDDSGDDSEESGAEASVAASGRRLGGPSAFKKRLMKELARQLRFRKW